MATTYYVNGDFSDESYAYTKFNAPTIIGVQDGSVVWLPVTNASGYTVSINGTSQDTEGVVTEVESELYVGSALVFSLTDTF